MSRKNDKEITEKTPATSSKNPSLNLGNMTPKEAISIQNELRSKVSVVPLKREIRTIAGVDISFNKYSNIVYAGVIVFSYPEMKEIERSLVRTVVHFPYIPGLLSFREIPALLEAWDKLKQKPDLVIADGQGICHPRRLGIATHFGLITGVPTIGAAKSLLTGTYEEPDVTAGSVSPIMDKKKNEMGIQEIIGMAVRTKNKVKPMIISPGHHVSMQQSIDIILACCRGYRMPEPTRHAHEITNEFRRAH